MSMNISIVVTICVTAATQSDITLVRYKKKTRTYSSVIFAHYIMAFIIYAADIWDESNLMYFICALYVICILPDLSLTGNVTEFFSSLIYHCYLYGIVTLSYKSSGHQNGSRGIQE